MVACSWPPSLGSLSLIPKGTSDIPQWTCTFPTLLQSWLWAVVETKVVESSLGSSGRLAVGFVQVPQALFLSG